ncbi:uncharacterized protein myripa isoform X2 [Misgurnus anguillicaudatus]|uniref:uncharacterized protein myripa isoform X2 n=1 Tax=Misgurnus anguillicaudatus TaxID=75329 RepID=UPI003CCFDA68
MGRKLDLSGLTDDEAEHVLQVVQRDMQLRKTEETRLSEMKEALVEEGSRSLLLSRQHRFNERCCIRCCSPFTFLLKPKRSCLDCRYNVCKSCCTYHRKDRGWLCSACKRSRLLKIQSLEWFYNNVRRRFKRFGSAKVLKNLYRRHAAERGVLAELTEGSTYEEEGIYNESSVYESDSTFYRQSEERSMAETISVALRVADEAIDEAIAKAERQTDSQEKQNEAHYLREHREELIEELATTIVQKIVQRRRDLSAMQSGDRVPPDQTNSAVDASLWRSHSALCLLPDETVEQNDNIGSRLSALSVHENEIKKEETDQAMLSWRSLDRLDNSMLQSLDGNWITYQSTPSSRPSISTKHKSLVSSVLVGESAYDDIDTESETEADGVWGSALQELRLKMSANKQLSYPESYSRQSTLPLDSKTQQLTAYSETFLDQDGPLHKSHKSLMPFLKRKVPLDQRRPSSTRRPCNTVDFNPGGAESSEDGLEDNRVKRSRRRRKNKKEDAEWKGQSVSDGSGQLSDALVKRPNVKHDPVLCDQDLEADSSDTATPDILSSGAITPEPWEPNDHRAQAVVESLDQELTSKLKALTSQISETQLSSTEDELDRLDHQIRDPENNTKENKFGEVMGDATFNAKERLDETEAAYQQIRTEWMEEDKLTSKFRELSREVTETQFSSTEDELDRFDYQIRDPENNTKEDDLMGDPTFDFEVDAKERSGETEAANERMEKDILTSKLKELTRQVSETQLSSTEDELDKSEHQIQFKATNQPIRTEILESDDNKTHNQDKLIQSNNKKTQSHVERMAEKAEAKRNIIENQTEMSGDINNDMQKQSLLVTDAQNEITRKTIAKTNSQRLKEGQSLAEGEQCGAEDTQTVDPNEEQRETLFITKGPEEEFDKIIDSSFFSEGRKESEEEKLEMIEDEEMKVNKGVIHQDNMECERSFVAESPKEVQEKERNKYGKINDGVREDAKVTEDNECLNIVKSEERLLNKVIDSQEDLDEKSEQQRDLVTQISVQHSAPSGQEQYLSPEEIYRGSHILDMETNINFVTSKLQQKYSAASLRSITTEVLKVLNATEDLIHGSMGDGRSQGDLTSIPPAEAKRLDEHLSRLEENVYVAAGTVFGLEAELGDLEECARSISGSTCDGELAHLEDQVASAAAQVQQSELQILDIAARIAALKHAGLNVAPQTQLSKTQTIGSSRKLRRRLPAPPMQDKEP